MTDPALADNVYLKPLTTKSIVQILQMHPDIDAVLPTMGGQTALNLCIEAQDKGIWDEFNVDIIGVDINAIHITEDREQFRSLMEKIGVGQAPSTTANSFLKGKEIAQEYGFPLVIRPSFTLCAKCSASSNLVRYANARAGPITVRTENSRTRSTRCSRRCR